MSRRTAKNDVLYLNIIAVLGILLILGAFFVSASLLTWSINDPSLSYASTGEINNIMGRAGAIVADALLQLFGLSVAFAVFPLFNWGWRMIFNAGVNRIHWRFMAWLASIMISCLTLSVFAIPPSWPLPGGLGGVSGDLLLKLIIDATGLADNSFVVILFAALCGITAAMLFCYALGVRLIGKSGKIKKSKRVKPANSANDEDKNSLFAVAIGGVLHVSYLLICWLKKLALSIYAMLKPERNKQRHQIARPNLGLDLPDTMIDYGEMDEHSDGSGETKKMRVVRRNQVGNFVLPSRNLLTNNKRQLVPEIDDTTLESNAKILEGVLDDFGVKGEVLRVCPGPLVTLYEFEPAPGIKSSRIIGLADDIARSMSALSARVSVVPGRNVIGIELPNEHRKTVYLREVFESRSFANVKQTLVLCLGLAIDGEPVVADLAGMPHLLIAGTTGSGKSVGINTMILSVLYRLSPDKCRLILIDPKMLELSVYDGIPHLLTPVVTDPKKAVVALKWAVKEMERRYRDMSRLGVRNIDGYNAKLKEIAQNGEDLSRTVQTGFDDETGEAVFETEQLDLEPIPYIVVVVDEMADLMMVAGKDIEAAIQRLAQMARAAGIHLIMATQRPSVDVITGTIKANFPTRISFQVTSKIDSRTILGEQGAEQLLGRGLS